MVGNTPALLGFWFERSGEDEGRNGLLLLAIWSGFWPKGPASEEGQNGLWCCCETEGIRNCGRKGLD
jgi:hypothetical protein